MPPPADQGPGPHRTCIGCRRVRSQGALVRLVRGPDGTFAVGRTLPGRGAWLCQDSPSCFDRALREGGFARSFRASAHPDAIAAVRSQLTEVTGRPGSDFVPATPAARD